MTKADRESADRSLKILNLRRGEMVYYTRRVPGRREAQFEIYVDALTEPEKQRLAELEQGILDLAHNATEETMAKIVLKNDDDIL